MEQQQQLFDESHRQQQHYVKTAEIQRNLRETKETALRVLTKLSERGESLDRQEEQARFIMESSEQVAEAASETNKRCCCWFFCKNKKGPPPPPPPLSQPLLLLPKKKKRIFHFSK
jgi:hypothetical protein